MAVWYVDSAQWTAVTAWPANTAKAAGTLIRQNAAPAVGNERVFVAIVGGTTAAVTEPTWTVTKGAKTTDNTVTWQECTGQPAVNGDLTNTPNWTSVKNTSVSLGKIITDNAGTHIFICSTAGTAGNGAEPSWNTAAVGNTTADNTVTWTYIGTSFSAWAAPHARVQAAIAANWGAAGDTFYLGNDHAETQSTSMTLTLPGTAASPNFLYSIDHTASLPPGSGNLLAGASLASTATVSDNLLVNGSFYWYGTNFKAGTGTNTSISLGFQSTGGHWQSLDGCTLTINSTNNTATNTIIFGNSQALGGRVDLNNTTMNFGHVSNTVTNRGLRLRWRNTASAFSGSAPTSLFGAGSLGGVTVLEGIDLSAMGSGTTIVPAVQDNIQYYLIDCKLGASVTIAATPLHPSGQITDAIRCSNAGTNYVQRRYWYEGTLQEETTIVRTGGATDGTTALSWKITTTANSRWVLPFECFPISIWNATTAANVTVTVYGIWGGGAVPNNDDIWIEVEYLGSSGSPLASFANDTKSNNLATGSALSSDSSSWGGSTTAFKMSVTLSSPQPQLVGYLRVYVKAAKASSTFYIDPLPVLS